jgi:thymidylate synthase (FAD)
MKIITDPTVTLVSRPQFIETALFPIPDDGDDAVKLGAFSAKVCYDSVGKNGRANEKNQRRIIETQHGSVLEHINYTLYITGISRGLSLESNRHRQLAVSQRSTRYTAEEDAAIVLDPFYAALYKKYEPFITDPSKDDLTGLENFNIDELNLLASHIASLETAFDAYERDVVWLSKLNPLNLDGFELRKWARGKARNLLPHALETRISYTGNVRAWRWVIEARSDAHAEDEIRRLANAILLVLRNEAPLYFDDFENTGDVRGIPVWKPAYSKV